jgi:hypothetical protein
MDRPRDVIDDPLRLDRLELIKLQHHRSLLAHGQNDRAGIVKAPAGEHFHLGHPVGSAGGTPVIPAPRSNRSSSGHPMVQEETFRVPAEARELACPVSP